MSETRTAQPKSRGGSQADRHRHDPRRHLHPQPRLRLDADARASSASASSASPAAGGVVKGLGVSQNPDVDFPVVNVSVTYEGASPEIMETDVVDPIEDAVTSVEGVKQISSTSRQGSANITVEFELAANIDAAAPGRADARSRRPRAACPRELDPPSSPRTTPRTSPIIWLSLVREPLRRRSWPTTSATCSSPQFQTIPGVGEVILGGYRERTCASGSTPRGSRRRASPSSDVIARHRSASTSSCRRAASRRAEREMNVRAEGEAIDLEAFRQLVVAYADGAPRAASGRGAWSRTASRTAAALARAMGEPAVGFGIRKQRGANAVAGRPRRARRKLEEIAQAAARRACRSDVNFDSTDVRRGVDPRDPLHAGPGRAPHRRSSAGSSWARGRPRSTCSSPSRPRSSARSS